MRNIVVSFNLDFCFWLFLRTQEWPSWVKPRVNLLKPPRTFTTWYLESYKKGAGLCDLFSPKTKLVSICFLLGTFESGVVSIKYYSFYLICISSALS